MPGLAAGPEIFENLTLPNAIYDLHYLQWKKPLHSEEIIANYAMRMCEDILHKNPVLVGVSFGGIMVQEMSQFITTKKVPTRASNEDIQVVSFKNSCQLRRLHKIFLWKIS
jgi:hypothetical protein